jgi:AAA family ATP:ADP antiporter
MIFGSVAMSTPFVAGILLVTILAWMLAVRSLGKQFNALTGETPSSNRAQETPLAARG